jgi:hypothetical protein
MKELSIRNGLHDVRNPAYNRKVRAPAATTDGYVFDIVDKVPLNQLEAFRYVVSSWRTSIAERSRFMHSSALQPRVLEILARHQTQSLQELSVYEFAGLAPENFVLPNRLRSFECRSVQDGKAVADLIRVNRATLQRLSLGQDHELVHQYAQTRVGFLGQDARFASVLESITLQNLPNLRELELCGIDLAPLLPTEDEDGLFLCNLTKLSLASCPGSSRFLNYLMHTFHLAQQSLEPTKVSLRHFLLRNEAPSAQLKESLLLFLDSFRGLRTLSLLLENASVLERVSTILCEHGPTLSTLVLETRIQPRDNLGLDTSRPFGSGGYSQELWEQSIRDICALCPNLVELGMGFPWDDEVVRLRKTRLPTLPYLKTVHIRNFPENRALSQIGDYTVKEYAQKFIDWVFPTPVGGGRPVLETLVIGPTLYESRWKMNAAGGGRRMPPEFQRSHFYGIDWALTRFGRWHSMVSPVSERYMEEVRGTKPLGGVFEQVWLK